MYFKTELFHVCFVFKKDPKWNHCKDVSLEALGNIKPKVWGHFSHHLRAGHQEALQKASGNRPWIPSSGTAMSLSAMAQMRAGTSNNGKP